MRTFLQNVAKDILAKHGAENLADIAVVFPNKRASLFLNQALYEETATRYGARRISPSATFSETIPLLSSPTR